MINLNRNAVVSALAISPMQTTQPLCGWESFLPRSQGSRSGNPGLEGEAPLGQQNNNGRQELIGVTTMWIRKALRDHRKGVDTPMPTQAVSNEEFIPRPQSEPQKQVEQLIGEMSEARAKKLGIDRRG